MGKWVFIFSICIASLAVGQELKFENLLTDKISIRAIKILDNSVYYAGSDSKFGFVSLVDSLQKKQILLNEDKLEFRTLTQWDNYFVTINVGSPAFFYLIDKKTLKADVFHSDHEKNAFYDALHKNRKYLYTFSDPNPNLKLKLIMIADGENEIKIVDVGSYADFRLKDGEAAFAASNSNIASSKKYLWLATGGKVARIIRMNLKTYKFEVFNTPIIHGTSSQGIYSIDFYKGKFGIAVGGDYTKQSENINNIATTTDSGKTWNIQASGKNAGYKTCVKIRPGSKGKEIMSVGDQNIEFSKDYGKTWTKISDEKGLFVCEWINRNTLVFAGKNRILKAIFR